MARKRVTEPVTAYDVIGKQTFRDFEAFRKFHEGYPDKRGVSVSVYRLAPSIDLSLIGEEKKHIQVILNDASLTVEAIAEAHGNGHYFFAMSDANRRPAGEVARSWLKINEPTLEPKLDPRTLKLSDPANADYIKSLLAKKVLVHDASGQLKVRDENDIVSAVVQQVKGELVTAPPPPQPPPAPVPPPAGMDVTGQILLKLMDATLAGKAQAPTTDLLESIKAVVSIQQTLQPQGPIVDLAKTLLQRLELQQHPASAQGSEFETYRRIKALIDEMRPPSPEPVVVAGGSMLESLFSGLAAIAPHVPTLINAWGTFRAMSSAPPQPSVFAPAMTHPYAAPPVRTGAAVASPAAAAAENPVPPTDEEGTMIMNLLSNPQLLNKIETVAKNAVAACQRQVDPLVFADSLIQFDAEGRQVFDALAAIGAERIQMMLQMNPAAAAIVAPAGEQFWPWFREFLEFDPDGEEEQSAEGGHEA